MYTQFFGLREKPFEITPDPRFLYLSESHQEALASLIYAVQEKKGFTVITGEVGTGKTTLVQVLLNQLDGRAPTAYLFNPILDPQDFLHSLCDEFDLKVEGGSKRECLARLQDFLLQCYAEDRNVLLIIDEAQTLSVELLEEIRLLTNFETARSKLLQVILIGQPELNEIFAGRRVRPLRQRISLRFSLQPLNRREVGEYVANRLRIAGAGRFPLFTPGAMGKIYRYSRGIPRLVNMVCDHALLTAYGRDQQVIEKDVVQEVIRDLKRGGARKRWGWLLLAFICGVLAIGILWAVHITPGGLETFSSAVWKGIRWIWTIVDGLNNLS